MSIPNTLMQWLASNPWLNLVFLILSILSVITSVVLYYKSKKEKEPCYRTRSFPLIRDNISSIKDVEIKYKNEKVENLTLTKFAFWNQGRDTINNIDIPPTDRLRLEIVDGSKFLNAEIIHQTKHANNTRLNLTDNGKVIEIDFDYLHTWEGVVCQIYHTAKPPEAISLQGTIKGVSLIREVVDDEKPLANSFVRLIIRGWVKRLLRGKYGHMVMILVLFIIMPITTPLLILDTILSPIRAITQKRDAQFNLSD